MALPYAGVLAYEAIQIGVGLKLDYDRGTTRNTTENLWSTAGAATGAVAGGLALAEIGTLICPGIGTVVGATIGATVGGIEGDEYARNRAGAIFDRWQYDIKIRRCKKCKRRYRCRMYTDQPRNRCANCPDDEDDDNGHEN